MVDLDSIIAFESSSSSSLLHHPREGPSAGIVATTTTTATPPAMAGAAYGDSNKSHPHDPATSLTLALAPVEQLLSAVKARRMPLLGLSASLSPDHQVCRRLMDVGMREVLPLPLHKHAREVLLKYGRLYRHFNNDVPPHDSGDKAGGGNEKPPSPKAAGDKGNNNVGSTPRTARRVSMIQPSPRQQQQQHKSQSTSPYLNNHPHLGGGGAPAPDTSVSTIHINNNNR